MKFKLLIFLSFVTFLFPTNYINAQNPISPPGVYIADPEAHVWEDGRLYIYGSRDESDDYWCSYSHHVLSTNNLIDWHLTQNSFASKGSNDQIGYHDKLLFAPDCAFSNGTYYFYYCSPGKELTEGVATSNSPNGPFINGKQIKGAYQIDPAVLIDDDGQGYYYWGQGNPKVAKLKPNLMEIDESTITKPLDEAGNKAFHEGSSIRKIGDLYYLVFADDSRDNRPTCLGYAIGKSPMGPFEYRGVIIDNIGCDPSVWNNHGSIEKFNGQWYVFYHRSTHNSKKFRKACLEPIEIEKDGTIKEVEMTSQGALEYIPANSIIETEWACVLNGNVRINQLSTNDTPSEGISEIKNGDYAGFKYISFTQKIKHFEAKVHGLPGGTLEIYIDSPTGKKIGECLLNSSTSNVAYQTISCEISKVSGKHSVWLIFKGNDNVAEAVDWFRFY